MSGKKGSSGVEYSSISEIKGPLIIVQGVSGIAYDELVEVESDGGKRLGRVLDVGQGIAVVQVFEGTSGLAIASTRARFLGRTMEIPVSQGMLGRIFDGVGKARDGLPEPIAEDFRDINGAPINPQMRDYPTDFIQTGISTIDGMNTLVRGQKLPIFSGAGLPHNALAAQIARQATVPGQTGDFAVVFAAIGVQNDEARFFQKNIEESGAMKRSALFLNLADDPVFERIITPRVALTFAEYLAFDLDMHVLVIITDMTNYAEALREISAAREEVPGRRGYPGYLYTDFASIYERAGRIKGKKGSITQMPILSMPSDDITHPIPDLTGYITEGQLFLSRDLYRKGIYPPIGVLMSLSRLMKDGIGEDMTRGDHQEVSNQLYATYSRAEELRALAFIVGESSLTTKDLKYLTAGSAFETRFLKQRPDEDRDIEQTLSIAWDILSDLPEDELTRIKENYIKQHYKGDKQKEGKEKS